MSLEFNEPITSILSFNFFDYYLKSKCITYNQDNEYSPDFDNFAWDTCHRLNYDYLIGKTKLVVESIDVEILKIVFPTIEIFTGNLVFQSFKGNYNTPNYKIFNSIIKACPKLKHVELHNLNPLRDGNKFVIDLDLLGNSSVEDLTINSNIQINENNLTIVDKYICTKLNVNRKINIKVNIEAGLLNILSTKYNKIGIFLSK